jgi:hypothetical protein
MTLHRFLAAFLLLLAACSATGQATDSTPPIESPRATETDQSAGTGADTNGSSWATTGYTLSPGVEAYPYETPYALDSYPTDETGLHLYERDGTRHVHPVGQGQYVIAMLRSFDLTGDEAFLDRAILNLDSLLASSTEVDEAIFFPYTFDYPLYGLEELTVHAPWWSGMAQGQILSALVRAYEATGDERYRDAADSTFESFSVQSVEAWPLTEPAVSLVDEDGVLWLEEYSGDLEPAYVLNGHLFATFGLYDYWELTGSEEAERMIDGAATAVAHYLPQFRNGPGELSWYGLAIKPDPLGLNVKYHRIHKRQLRALANMTGERLFSDYADLFTADL